jgi:hypothetical protein
VKSDVDEKAKTYLHLNWPITSFIIQNRDKEVPPREGETVADGLARGRESKSRPRSRISKH